MEKELVTVNLDLVKSKQNLLDEFLNSREIKQLKETTRLLYSAGIRRFFDYLEANNIQADFSARVIDDYRDYLGSKESNLKSTSASAYIVSLRVFCKWFSRTMQCPNIADGIKSFKVSKVRRRNYLTEEQGKALLSEVDRKTLAGKRDYALLKIFLYTGVRVMELEEANIEDIRQDSDEQVLWIKGKGCDAKDKWVKVTKCMPAINEYLNSRKSTSADDPLFISVALNTFGQRMTNRSISRIAKNYLRKIGLNQNVYTCHSLRHTFATLALKNGAPLPQIQATLRHASITTTQLYAENLTRMEDAAEDYVNYGEDK